jgi:hypothetical protein
LRRSRSWNDKPPDERKNGVKKGFTSCVPRLLFR